MSIRTNLNQTEQALPRTGTCCQFCGRPITTTNYISCHGGSKGGIIYGHVECCEIAEYSKRLPDTFKKPTYSGFTFGCEFETNQGLLMEERLFLWACYGLYSTHDCTVREELKSLRNNGLHGVKTYLQGIKKVVDIASGDNCGTHCTVSLAKWNNGTARLFRQYSEMFIPLAQRMKYGQQDTINTFGRYFSSFNGGGYSYYTENSFVHGAWLNIRDNGGLEFRICKFQSVEQYSMLLFLLKEFTLILDKSFLKNPNSYNASITALKLVKAYEKHLNRTATYFRSERNTIDR